jgi:hydrogenase expression/formation protein HypE
MLGLDSYSIASEGRALMAVNQNQADNILEKIKLTSIGKDAEIIGVVKSDNPKRVLLNTIVGGTRFVDMPIGENIPRIC